MRLVRAALIVTVGAAALALAFFAWSNRVVRGPGEAATFVEQVLPVPREEVLAAVGQAFHSAQAYAPARAGWMDGCYARPFEPGDELSMDWGSDPGLLRFIALPADQKRHDFWLVCFDEWASEYQSPRGEPLPFTTKFIVHVEPVSADATRVEVIEYFPYVIAGRTLGFARHAVLPGWIPDMRRVAPTTRDRVEVLNRIREALPPR